ncbi:CEI_1a_G0027190.mRNA.1.CDS.1 [Saccharomyces cerevisiae]|nr:EM14S01-3B_G0053360.mRNA.1.CDS.1 [Saccharomyces cerevisiae]CAI4397551.1 AMH_1a_G0027260.mRNA.1.CDS.1 [Saccharomyces cerevisiae]CAI4407806.1 CEI_1a_G0027190.mRNA.1.CDS.1 [Saccharomyces cerevisiae]CAI6609799.1 AMH_1a_G0027260.mRNA.1.CDS.1 [Saccharomyces cerevisiae]CAI7246126.1 CEI_1a_G0027190.mRNA.1.CDS.1 [Saccharomyces cerevisiae]
MNGTRCLLGVGLPVDVTATETLTHDEQGPGVEPGPCSRGGSMDGLLPSLLGPHDDVDDDSAAFHKYMTLSRDGAGAIHAPSLVEDASRNDDDDDEDDDDDDSTMSRDLSKALDMSSSSSSSPRVKSRRHRSSVSTISAILHQGKSGREDITGSLSVPAEQEKLSFLAKASSIFFRRNSMPRDKHTHSVCPASRPDSERFIVTSAAAQSLRRQQQLEDAQYARVITNFRTIGWCSPSEIKSVEYKRSLINAEWDEKISLLSHAQYYK